MSVVLVSICTDERFLYFWCQSRVKDWKQFSCYDVCKQFSCYDALLSCSCSEKMSNTVLENTRCNRIILRRLIWVVKAPRQPQMSACKFCTDRPNLTRRCPRRNPGSRVQKKSDLTWFRQRFAIAAAAINIYTELVPCCPHLFWLANLFKWVWQAHTCAQAHAHMCMYITDRHQNYQN